MHDLPPGAPTPWAPAPAGIITVYRGATLFDGTGSAPRPGTTIVTDGAVLHTVTGDGDPLPPIAADADRIDLDGRFVVPGLIDTHQHLATPPNRPMAEAVLRRLVYGGVTAVRDMADDLRHISDLARAALIGEVPGPDIRYAALMAGPSFFSDPRTRSVCQGAEPGAIPWMQAITPDTDLPIAVALARGTHAAAIKMYADLDADTVAAITAEAHRQNMLVWAHATVFPAAPGDVVAAGADSLSHATLLAFEDPTEPLGLYKAKPPVAYGRFAADTNPRLAALFAEMRRRGTVLDATACMSTIDELKSDTAESAARARRKAELAATVTAQAHRAGVDLCTGTDHETDPGAPFPALFDELAFRVERCGISTADVLRSATLIGARAAGTEAVMGTVAPGKLANFTVLNESPLQDIRNLRSITLTVKRGHRYDRAEFEEGRQ
ncbi:hydrolase [Streptomyces rimosus subsp. pseudoverticillatus]|uniref:amidohydrolase family protein n=1 Tax=Streptomyces rimosus TaxID=1927 RepID=UPI0006B27A8F|nr:amidohydrolase family protein [Streptomyces rimosus]KOT84718.1 hydrolase [Streptomyces rimosus subsp. pseudoverticillatus]